MLNQIEQSEKNAKETPILTAAELREVLPAGFVGKLDRMDVLTARASEINTIFGSSDEDASVEVGTKSEGLSAQFAFKAWVCKKNKPLVNAFNFFKRALLGDLKREMGELKKEYEKCKSYTVIVGNDQDGLDTYVECEVESGAMTSPRITVELGSGSYDKGGLFTRVGTDDDRVRLSFDIGAFGVERITMNRFGVDKDRSWEEPEAQESIKEDALKILELAAEVDGGGYVNVEDVEFNFKFRDKIKLESPEHSL